MRMTAEVIRHAPKYVNPLKERHLSLRGYKIPVVENLGVTMDLYDTIDLSENDLMKLDNFPLLKNLQTLLLSNNRISLVSPSLSSSVPKLQTIMFTNNKLKAFRDIDSLAQFKGLHTLSLTGNPVCKTAHYREYVIFRLPHLKLLDFNKIKPREREAAKKRFGTIEEYDAKQKQQTQSMDTDNTDTTTSMNVDDNDEDNKKEGTAATTETVQRKELTADERKDILKKIGQADSIEEVNRLEALLNQ